jgi:hypothetical protein
MLKIQSYVEEEGRCHHLETLIASSHMDPRIDYLYKMSIWTVPFTGCCVGGLIGNSAQCKR